MKKSDLLDLYLQDKLNQEQLQQFKTQLNEDPVFNKEFQELKEIRFAIRHNARLDIHSKLNQFESSLNHQPVNRPKRNIKPTYIVGILVILTLAVAIYLQGNRSINSPQEVYVKLYELPDLGEIIENPSVDLSSPKATPVLAYQSGNFRLANQSMLEVLDSIQGADLYMISGLSAMEVGNFELALDQFNIVVNHYDKYKDLALWYSGLSFLATDKKTEALITFYELSLINDQAYDILQVFKRLGVKYNEKSSLGIIESTFADMDSISNKEPISQNGFLSDLTTRTKYEYYLIAPRQVLKTGDVVTYIPLEDKTDLNPIGIGFVKQEK